MRTFNISAVINFSVSVLALFLVMGQPNVFCAPVQKNICSPPSWNMPDHSGKFTYGIGSGRKYNTAYRQAKSSVTDRLRKGFESQLKARDVSLYNEAWHMTFRLFEHLDDSLLETQFVNRCGINYIFVKAENDRVFAHVQERMLRKLRDERTYLAFVKQRRSRLAFLASFITKLVTDQRIAKQYPNEVKALLVDRLFIEGGQKRLLPRPDDSLSIAIEEQMLDLSEEVILLTNERLFTILSDLILEPSTRAMALTLSKHDIDGGAAALSYWYFINNNRERAEYWLSRSTKHNNHIARTVLGKMYFESAVHPDSQTSLSWIRQQLKSVNLKSAANSSAYRGVFDLMPEPERADMMPFLDERANNVRAFDVVQLADTYLYLEGELTRKNPYLAAKGRELAAVNGDDASKLAIAEIYEIGKGVPRNFEKALDWYVAAAVVGQPKACYVLGNIYSTGRGLPKDLSKAIYWYSKAAGKLVEAKMALGYLYLGDNGVEPNFSEAFRWFKSAYDQKSLITSRDAEAAAVLGILYYRGLGVQKDYSKAKKYLWMAAVRGDQRAQNQIEQLFLDGKAVRQNMAEAAYWVTPQQRQKTVARDMVTGEASRSIAGEIDSDDARIESITKIAAYCIFLIIHMIFCMAVACVITGWWPEWIRKMIRSDGKE